MWLCVMGSVVVVVWCGVDMFRGVTCAKVVCGKCDLWCICLA